MSCFTLAISPEQRDVLVRILRANAPETMPDDVFPIDTHAFADMLDTMIPSFTPEHPTSVLNGLCL